MEERELIIDLKSIGKLGEGALYTMSNEDDYAKNTLSYDGAPLEIIKPVKQAIAAEEGVIKIVMKPRSINAVQLEIRG